MRAGSRPVIRPLVPIDKASAIAFTNHPSGVLSVPNYHVVMMHK